MQTERRSEVAKIGAISPRPLSVMAFFEIGPVGPPSAPSASASATDDGAAFVKALLAVSFAEVFDKTWFVTLVMSINKDKFIALSASYLGLVVHVFIAAGLGYAVSQIPGVQSSTLEFICAGMMLLFAVWYAYDACYDEESDEEVLAGGRAEIEGELGMSKPVPDEESKGGEPASDAPAPTATERSPIMPGAEDDEWASQCQRLTGFNVNAKIFSQALMVLGVVFMAEWGDRTQFVMISLHASQPLWPVIFGSALSFALLCSSAVLCAMAIEKSLVNFKLTKRTLNLIVAAAFVCFAFISLHDAIHDQEDGE